MFSFVDLHCHILFRVDDGAHDEETMKNMIDIAYNDGTRTICFTPHFKIFEFDSDESIYSHCERLKHRFGLACEYVNENHPDLQLFLGNEIMYHSDIYDSLSSGKCNFLGKSSYALIEFNPDTPAFEIEKAILQLLRKGITPLIAHIERYSAFIKNTNLLESLKESGALLQVNARSVTKFKFGKISRFLKTVFKKRLVDVIASDAHNTTSFSPILSHAFELISKRYGEDYAKKIFHDTPLSILKNEKIY